MRYEWASTSSPPTVLLPPQEPDEWGIYEVDEHEVLLMVDGVVIVADTKEKMREWLLSALRQTRGVAMAVTEDDIRASLNSGVFDAAIAQYGEDALVATTMASVLFDPGIPETLAEFALDGVQLAIRDGINTLRMVRNCPRCGFQGDGDQVSDHLRAFHNLPGGSA